ncbi:hypothetical protein PENDEC_c002G01256 [Penicillium decumbens]|uniref:BTB domain-containing protein n=1 Tax=Penicillium decumbens TaxID=69771 RepID=A0A1V6PLJ0_PENDC|nr:hypothetical protein PENDEC_c002G01256 [Penicillium decumbens]
MSLRFRYSRKFAVHRAVVCSQSPVFDAMLKHGFKEATSSHIDLPDDDLAAVQRLLAFLYLRGYDDKKDQNLQNGKAIPSDGDEPDVVVGNNLDVFMVADKFEFVPLKNLARSRLIH